LPDFTGALNQPLGTGTEPCRSRLPVAVADAGEIAGGIEAAVQAVAYCGRPARLARRSSRRDASGPASRLQAVLDCFNQLLPPPVIDALGDEGGARFDCVLRRLFRRMARSSMSSSGLVSSCDLAISCISAVSSALVPCARCHMGPTTGANALPGSRRPARTGPN